MKKTPHALAIAFLALLLVFPALASAECVYDAQWPSNSRQMLWTWEPKVTACGTTPAIFSPNEDAKNEKTTIKFSFQYNPKQSKEPYDGIDDPLEKLKRFKIELTDRAGNSVRTFGYDDFEWSCENAGQVKNCETKTGWNANIVAGTQVSQVALDAYYYAYIDYFDGARRWGPLELFPTKEKCDSCGAVPACNKAKCDALGNNGNCAFNARIANDISASPCYPASFETAQTREQYGLNQLQKTGAVKTKTAAGEGGADYSQDFTEEKENERAKALLGFASEWLSEEADKLKGKEGTPDVDLVFTLVRRSQGKERDYDSVLYEAQGVKKILSMLENDYSLGSVIDECTQQKLDEEFQQAKTRPSLQETLYGTGARATNDPSKQQADYKNLLQNYASMVKCAAYPPYDYEDDVNVLHSINKKALNAALQNPVVHAVFEKHKQRKFDEATEARLMFEKANAFEKKSGELHYAKAFYAYGLISAVYGSTEYGALASQKTAALWNRVAPEQYRQTWWWKCLAPMTDARFWVAGAALGEGMIVVNVVMIAGGTKGLVTAVNELQNGRWEQMTSKQKTETGLELACNAIILYRGIKGLAKEFKSEPATATALAKSLLQKYSETVPQGYDKAGHKIYPGDLALVIAGEKPAAYAMDSADPMSKLTGSEISALENVGLVYDKFSDGSAVIYNPDKVNQVLAANPALYGKYTSGSTLKQTMRKIFDTEKARNGGELLGFEYYTARDAAYGGGLYTSDGVQQYGFAIRDKEVGIRVLERNAQALAGLLGEPVEVRITPQRSIENPNPSYETVKTVSPSSLQTASASGLSLADAAEVARLTREARPIVLSASAPVSASSSSGATGGASAASLPSSSLNLKIRFEVPSFKGTIESKVTGLFAVESGGSKSRGTNYVVRINQGALIFYDPFYGEMNFLEGIQSIGNTIEAKTYSGLTDEFSTALKSFVKANAEKATPLTPVQAARLFEIPKPRVPPGTGDYVASLGANPVYDAGSTVKRVYAPFNFAEIMDAIFKASGEWPLIKHLRGKIDGSERQTGVSYESLFTGKTPGDETRVKFEKMTSGTLAWYSSSEKRAYVRAFFSQEEMKEFISRNPGLQNREKYAEIMALHEAWHFVWDAIIDPNQKQAWIQQVKDAHAYYLQEKAKYPKLSAVFKKIADKDKYKLGEEYQTLINSDYNHVVSDKLTPESQYESLADELIAFKLEHLEVGALSYGIRTSETDMAFLREIGAVPKDYAGLGSSGQSLDLPPLEAAAAKANAPAPPWRGLYENFARHFGKQVAQLAQQGSLDSRIKSVKLIGSVTDPNKLYPFDINILVETKPGMTIDYTESQEIVRSVSYAISHDYYASVFEQANGFRNIDPWDVWVNEIPRSLDRTRSIARRTNEVLLYEAAAQAEQTGNN